MERSKNLIVKNRSASMVVYSLPELNVRREFMPGESKTITFGELEKLSYQPGGRSIMQNFLQIIDPDATNDLGIQREPEYNLSLFFQAFWMEHQRFLLSHLLKLLHKLHLGW